MSEASAQGYEAEQDKLRNEYEGTSDIAIEAPKEPEVNPEVYKDVEPLLYRGFLTVSAEINGVYFVFKSLNHHEFELLRFSGGVRGERVNNAFWNTLLAYGVFMVDGINVLPERDRWLPKITELFGDLPKEARGTLLRYLSEVNRRASNATTLTEAYAMESTSRFRWIQLRGVDLTSVSATGIDGTQRLGLNWAQQLWRALNFIEDRNEEHEREWENAKFIGSCFAGKGLQKVYTQDSERRAKDKESKAARKDRVLREIVLGERFDDNASDTRNAVVIVPKTADELADQLQKDLRGDKDWHDKVIEDYENRIKDHELQRRDLQLEAARAHEAMFGPKNVTGTSSLQGLTPQEMELQVHRRKQLEAQQAARMQVLPDEKTQAYLEKMNFLGDNLDVGVSTTDKDLAGVVSLPPTTRTPTTPFRRK